MVVLRFLVKALKLLNSETAAASIAASVALGMFLGLVPLLTLQALLVLAVVLFLRVNLMAAIRIPAAGTGLASKPAPARMPGLFDPIFANS